MYIEDHWTEGGGGSNLFSTPTPPPTRCKVEPRFSCEEIVAHFKLFFPRIDWNAFLKRGISCIYFLHVCIQYCSDFFFWKEGLLQTFLTSWRRIPMEKKFVNNTNLFAKIYGLYLNYKTITKVQVLPCFHQISFNTKFVNFVVKVIHEIKYV